MSPPQTLDEWFDRGPWVASYVSLEYAHAANCKEPYVLYRELSNPYPHWRENRKFHEMAHLIEARDDEISCPHFGRNEYFTSESKISLPVVERELAVLTIEWQIRSHLGGERNTLWPLVVANAIYEATDWEKTHMAGHSRMSRMAYLSTYAAINHTHWLNTQKIWDELNRKYALLNERGFYGRAGRTYQPL